MSTLRSVAAALAAIGLAVSLTACSSSESDSPDDGPTSLAPTAEIPTEYCDGADQVRTELERFSSLVDEGAPDVALKEQRDFVLAAIQANSVALSQLPEETRAELDVANTGFQESVEAVPEDASPEDAAAAYGDAIQALDAAVADAEAEVGCS